jgi:Acyl-CoA thioester hydrolase/BAAT N-terminal region
MASPSAIDSLAVQNPALASPMIVIDQPVALIDSAIAIELRGFPPRQPVSVTAIQTFPSTARWRATATFMSDDDGCVYVARQAPVSGT